MRITVYGASSNAIDDVYINTAEELGRIMATRGHSLTFGGGASGVMGAVARGVYEKGGKILGIAPRFFSADGILFENCTDFIYTETMRERKKLLEDNCDAFIIAPGGIGTYDELFEILTLKQLGRHVKCMVIYNVNGYYDPLIELLKHGVKGKFFNQNTIDLLFIANTAEEVIDYVESYKGEKKPLTHFKSVNNDLAH